MISEKESEPIGGLNACSKADGIRAEYLDFRDRSRGTLHPNQIPKEIDQGRFVWVDIDIALVDLTLIKTTFSSGLCLDVDIPQMVKNYTGSSFPSTTGLNRTDQCLHFSFFGGSTCGSDDVGERLDVVVGKGFLITLHNGQNAVLNEVRRDYVHDFETHAATPSFLLYEIFNEQVEQFLMIQGKLEDQVEETRRALAKEVDQSAFALVASVSAKLLTLRRRALPLRRTLEELTSRKTVLVSEATLTFLKEMVHTIERLLSDIASDREILETALNLSLTVMSHRTNQTMNRLAVVSTIFLPLTFICGIYGMNFEVMPELDWDHGYIYFWGLSACITVGLMIVLRRARLL